MLLRARSTLAFWTVGKLPTLRGRVFLILRRISILAFWKRRELGFLRPVPCHSIAGSRRPSICHERNMLMRRILCFRAVLNFPPPAPIRLYCKENNWERLWSLLPQLRHGRPLCGLGIAFDWQNSILVQTALGELLPYQEAPLILLFCHLCSRVSTWTAPIPTHSGMTLINLLNHLSTGVRHLWCF